MSNEGREVKPLNKAAVTFTEVVALLDSLSEPDRIKVMRSVATFYGISEEIAN